VSVFLALDLCGCRKSLLMAGAKAWILTQGRASFSAQTRIQFIKLSFDRRYNSPALSPVASPGCEGLISKIASYLNGRDKFD
jgi:hypothetical protein